MNDEQCAQIRANVPRSNVPRGIPVPPYDKELPQDYWDGLSRKQVFVGTKKNRSVTPWFFAIGVVCLLVGLYFTPRPLPKESVAVERFTPGQSYWVHMPDGRNIVINYKGEVASTAELPPQHGINNAAYITRNTGAMWIWTVPATGANIATWIDP